MAFDASDSMTAFPIAEADAANRPSRLEDEIVALFDRLRAPVLRYLLSFGRRSRRGGSSSGCLSVVIPASAGG